MRKITVGAQVSMDGVMQAPGGPTEDPTKGFKFGGWAMPYFNQEFGEEIDHLFKEDFDLLLGRKTYEIFAAYWPYQGDNPIAVAFNKATKYVATRSDRSFDWENTTVLRGDAVAQIAELKKGDGPPLLTQGSADLLQSLHRAGLVDEYSLRVFPLVLGRGKRLFEDGAAVAGLKLQSAEPTPSGVILATYTPAGEIPAGSFVTGEPSADELRRREEWAAEA